MKIETTSHTLERGNIGTESSFRIRSNRRAFQILSSNLYANKIKAVVRELSCNARDSHVAAGVQSVPFDVHLPNSMEPWFSVTDYGTGLSHDQIMDIYTTYFASSKSDSNEYIGALGLGSKSPFAYTNTYDVITNFNGEKHSYVMFISEDGEPSVAHMGTTKTSDRNGVTVKVPVKNEDFDNFRINAGSVFFWFDYQPVVIGNSNYRSSTIKKLMEGDGWYLRESDNYYDRGGTNALMGNVAYPINANQVNRKFYNLLNSRFVVEFQIGELDVAASREELSYDPVTIKVIEARLEKVAQNLVKQVETKFSNCATLWDARVALRAMHENYSTRDILRMLETAGVTPKFNGVAIDNYATLSTKDWFEKNNRPSVYKFHNTRMEKDFDIEVSRQVTFVRKNVHNTSSRVRLLYETDKSLQYWVIDATDEQFQVLMDNIGNPPVMLASDLVAPPRRVMEFKGSRYIGGGHCKFENWGDVVSLTTNMIAFYVTLDRYNPVDPNENIISNLGDKIRYAKKLGIIDENAVVWGINKTNAKKIEDDENWTEFSEFLKTKFNEFLDMHDISDIMHAKSSLNEINDLFYSPNTHWYHTFGNMNNSVGNFVREWKNTTVNSQIDLDSVRNLAHTLHINFNHSKKENPLMILYQKMMKDYPLLRHATRQYDNNLREWVPYIESMDYTTLNKKD